MATVLITGGSGMVGTALTKALQEKGYKVIILTRNVNQFKIENGKLEIEYAEWNVEKQIIDEKVISKADYIVHLAGANLGDRRWTKKRKEEIVSSRTESSRLIVDSLIKIPNKVKAVVSTSAIGYYGPDTTNGSAFKETDTVYDNFLGTTCKQWEESIAPVKQTGKRLVIFRAGVVLCNQGGILKEFKRSLNFGMETILGNGKQVMSWIHIDDLVRLYIAAIENENMSGVYNAVATNPASNKKIILTLAKTKKRFFIPFHVPAFVLKLIFGEMSIEVLKSATVSNDKLRNTGFTFLYPSVEQAIQQLINNSAQ